MTSGQSQRFQDVSRQEADNRQQAPDRQQTSDRFVELMDSISLGLRPPILQAWSEIELTMHQFRTLALLRTGPQRVSDIAARLGIRLSAATSFVDRLETKRLVERVHDSADRRVVQCQLTPLGRREADSLWKINREWLGNLTNTLSNEELEIIVKAFEVLASAIQRQAASNPESNM